MVKDEDKSDGKGTEGTFSIDMTQDEKARAGGLFLSHGVRSVCLRESVLWHARGSLFCVQHVTRASSARRAPSQRLLVLLDNPRNLKTHKNQGSRVKFVHDTLHHALAASGHCGVRVLRAPRSREQSRQLPWRNIRVLDLATLRSSI